MSSQSTVAATVAAWDAIAVHPADDVAVALHDVQAGETVRVRREGATLRTKVSDAVPLGHKFALRALAKGTPIRKYGECIGAATADIAAGSHVHVHNMASLRAQKST